MALELSSEHDCALLGSNTPVNAPVSTSLVFANTAMSILLDGYLVAGLWSGPLGQASHLKAAVVGSTVDTGESTQQCCTSFRVPGHVPQDHCFILKHGSCCCML